MRFARTLAILLAAGAITVGVGCRGREGELARLVETAGTVEAEKEPGKPWQIARAGEGFRVGEAVRTAAASSARLEFGNGKRLRLGEKALIRFAAGVESKSPALGVELGTAELEGAGAVWVNTARGPVRLDSGTRMRVVVGAADVRYEVLVGKAVLGEGTKEIALAPGDGIAIAIGGATLERYKVQVGEAVVEDVQAPAVVPTAPAVDASPPPSPVAAEAPGPDATEPRKGRPGEAADAVQKDPPPVDVTVPAGESAVIHGRLLPVHVRVRFGSGCTSGTVEVAPAGKTRARKNLQRVTGERSAVVVLGAGSHRYRLACAESPGAGGTLVVRKDAGTARVPRTAPVNTIDADGRSYTVLYQNRLPALTFVWPGAPAGPFELHVKVKEKEQVFEAPQARHRLRSGQLGEGEHTWWFASANGKSSAKTHLKIRFDNAAVAAQLQAPLDGRAGVAEPEVEVAGIAIEGSTVAVGDAALDMDAQGRFKGRVPRPGTGERAIAVRLEHPRSGVHYYIRRLARN